MQKKEKDGVLWFFYIRNDYPDNIWNKEKNLLLVHPTYTFPLINGGQKQKERALRSIKWNVVVLPAAKDSEQKPGHAHGRHTHTHLYFWFLRAAGSDLRVRAFRTILTQQPLQVCRGGWSRGRAV